MSEKHQVKIRKRLEWRILDKSVLVVAVEGTVKDWAAYIGAVDGDAVERDHWKEALEVHAHGT